MYSSKFSLVESLYFLPITESRDIFNVELAPKIVSPNCVDFCGLNYTQGNKKKLLISENNANKL